MIQMLTLQELSEGCAGVDIARVVDVLSALSPNYYVCASQVPETARASDDIASVVVAATGHGVEELGFLQVSALIGVHVLRQGTIETSTHGWRPDGPASHRRELTSAERLMRLGRQRTDSNGAEPPAPSLPWSLSRGDVWIRAELGERVLEVVLGQPPAGSASAAPDGARPARPESGEDDRFRALGQRLELILDARHPAHAPELAAAINIWETDVLPHPGEEPNKSFGDAYAASVSGDHIEWVRYRKGSQKGLPDETLDRLRRVVTPGARKKGGPIRQTRK